MTPHENLILRSGLAIFLGSKNMDLEQRCNFPSILNEINIKITIHV